MTFQLNFKDKPKAYIGAGSDSCQLLESMNGPITGIVGCTVETLQAGTVCCVLAANSAFGAGAKPPAGPSAVVGTVTLHMDLAGLVDMSAELKKLEDQLAIKQTGLKKISDQQANANYMKKPEAKREADTVKKAALEAEVLYCAL